MTQKSGRRDLRGELEREDGSYPDSIILKAGEIFAGRLRRYSSGSTQYGECIIAVVEDDETGELRSVWLIHEVLKREFARLRPKPGERLAVKYHGLHARGYHGWSLIVDRPEDLLPDFAGSSTEDKPPATGRKPLAEDPEARGLKPPLGLELDRGDNPPDDDIPF